MARQNQTVKIEMVACVLSDIISVIGPMVAKLFPEDSETLLFVASAKDAIDSIVPAEYRIPTEQQAEAAMKILETEKCEVLPQP